ncbi:MAG: hypothetical protein BAJALOKI3v1_880009 [Promethearchaeota archaeon]|nr:MAG: hypothetical protein BAJALOKI3v1_880009 [Candidatus Lokiarchaeota archaeon]
MKIENISKNVALKSDTDEEEEELLGVENIIKIVDLERKLEDQKKRYKQELKVKEKALKQREEELKEEKKLRKAKEKEIEWLKDRLDNT